MIQQRVQALDDEKLLGFIADFEQFEKDGHIGDSALRAEAEGVGKEFKAPHNVVLWMHTIAFEAYRELYRRSHARIAELEAQLAERTRERDVARLYCAEVANYVCDPMYDKAENRAGIALDAEAMATGVMTGRYLDIKTQTDRAIKAEAERDALRADAERFAWWFSFAPKPDWFVMQYLQGVCEKFTLDQWRYAIDAARAKEQK